MSVYYFNKKLDTSFDDAIKQITEQLKQRGFGILTEIDVKQTFKMKLDVEFRNYRILGACNPNFAFKAFTAEDKIGTMLPCNVIVQELEDGKIEVAAIDPIESMKAVENETLGKVASEVRELLKASIESL